MEKVYFNRDLSDELIIPYDDSKHTTTVSSVEVFGCRHSHNLDAEHIDFWQSVGRAKLSNDGYGWWKVVEVMK